VPGEGAADDLSAAKGHEEDGDYEASTLAAEEARRRTRGDDEVF
jgi:hypothetical protein